MEVGVKVRLMSFSYDLGVPKESKEPGALLFNVQKLPNPPSSLRAKRTGLDKDLQLALFALPQVLSTYDHIKDKIQQHITEKRDVRVYVGCFAGKHRSVALVDRLSHEEWSSEVPVEVRVVHRDIQGMVASKKDKSQKKQNDRKQKYHAQEDHDDPL
eukprot:TRINITY_DN3370_c0_g1_i1.p1 TRINITY_DN3370_c0_g1~~TRINITY_DN3370_c0_g1_i1.p1  ORF type:complete len:157 (+),score=35.73 TRINITY_DN3370_c0_g1_i1:15-485(+)